MCEFFGCDYYVLLTINMLCRVEVMFIQLLNLLERYFVYLHICLLILSCHKTIVIINSKEYSEKVHSFLNANNFNILTKDPTEKFHTLIHKTMQESNLIIDKKR